MSHIVGILLAAGSGQRFGAHKLLHPLVDGVPLGVAAARSLAEALPDTVAVVRPGDSVLRAALVDVGLSVIENPSAGNGMGGSLATGVRATADAAGWVIALADMPWISPATTRGLAGLLHEGASIVAPVHAGRRGHPVGFAAHWGPRLAALDGDRGARDLIAAYPDAVRAFVTGDAGVVQDVDRRSDLRRRADGPVGNTGDGGLHDDGR